MLNKLMRTVFSLGCFLFIAQAHAYTLSAGDSIRIAVYGEPDLTFDEFLIDSGETIDFPYLGNISLKNKTLKQVQEEITAGLQGDYLIDPKVTVNIVEYRNIYVNGVVNKPGGYEYQPGLTVQKSIALAGGFLAKYRKTKGIYVTKSAEIEGLSQKEIEDLLADKPEANLNDPVGPGDTIYVVSSFW